MRFILPSCLLIVFLGLVASPGVAEHPACHPPAELRAELATLDPDLSGCRVGEPCRAEAHARLEALLDEGGFDLHLAAARDHLEIGDGLADRETLAARARAEAERLGDDLDAWHLAGALAGEEDGEAILVEKVLAEDPNHPWAHLAITDWSARAEPAKAAEHLGRFLDQCPSRLRDVGRVLGWWRDNPIPADRLPVLERTTVELPAVERMATLPTLWRVQFLASPPDRHDALRERIREQTREIAALDRRDHRLWWDALEEGYELAGDADALAASKRERIEKFPCDRDSIHERVVEIVHRYDPNASDLMIKAKKLDFTPEQLPAVIADMDALDAECPEQRTLIGWRFRLLDQLEEPSADRLVAVSDAYLASETEGGASALNPPEFDVARVFVEHGVALERVPELIAAARSREPDFASYGFPPPIIERMKSSHERRQVHMARVAAVALDRLGRRDEARREAETASRLYRELDSETHASSLAGLHEDLSPLLADLDFPGLPAPAVPVETEEEHVVWQEVEEPLSELALTDLGGRSWTLADFADQGVLINFWATWCAPCIAELPEIQALHEELAETEGLTVVTFNTDREIGKVAPFLAQRGFDFPVLLASDFLPPESSSLPQNWLVDRRSVVRKKSTGFAVEGEGEWREEVRRLLEEVAGRSE